MTKQHVMIESVDGNWSLDGFLLGCDHDFINHMVNDQGWTPRDVVDYLINNVATALNAKVQLPAGMLILRVNCDTNMPSLDLVKLDAVDAIVGLHESSYTDFPVVDHCRKLEDNQYDYALYDIADPEAVSALDQHIASMIAVSTGYFDDVAGTDYDEAEYARQGEIMGGWCEVAVAFNNATTS